MSQEECCFCYNGECRYDNVEKNRKIQISILVSIEISIAKLPSNDARYLGNNHKDTDDYEPAKLVPVLRDHHPQK